MEPEAEHSARSDRWKQSCRSLAHPAPRARPLRVVFVLIPAFAETDHCVHRDDRGFEVDVAGDLVEMAAGKAEVAHVRLNREPIDEAEIAGDVRLGRDLIVCVEAV